MYIPVSTFFFFNDTATTEIYTLSLHDALPISARALHGHRGRDRPDGADRGLRAATGGRGRGALAAGGRHAGADRRQRLGGGAGALPTPPEQPPAPAGGMAGGPPPSGPAERGGGGWGARPPPPPRGPGRRG